MLDRGAGLVILAVTIILIGSQIRAVEAGSSSIYFQGAGQAVSSISAASFESTEVAPESIVAAFGTSLATQTVVATDVDPAMPGIQLPTDLGGTTVEVNGRRAGLFFISPNQVNYVVPLATEEGTANVVVRAGNGTVSNGTIEVQRVAPAVFTANSNGGGVPAAFLVRVKADGSQIYEDLMQFNAALGQFVPKSINPGPAGERVFIVLFLTGIRRADDPNQDGNRNENVRVLVGGSEIVPIFAGSQPDFIGLDQVNVEIPRSLIGRGVVDLAVLATDFSASNLVTIEIAGTQGISPPLISGFGSQSALAGEVLAINGAGFSPTITENHVKIGGVDAEVMEATGNQLKVSVPFGAGTGTVQIRTLGGESESQQLLPVRTSISGFVENTLRQPMPGVTVRIPDLGITATTNFEGAFVLPDVPPGVQLVEVLGSSFQTNPPFPNVALKIAAQTSRDNQISRPIALQQATGSGAGVGSGGSFNDESSILQQGPAVSIQTGNFKLEFQNNPKVLFPSGATNGNIFLTPLLNARTPINLPYRYFSSSIVQITPFNVQFDPGGRLVFPNLDNFPAGQSAALFRYDSSIGRFVLEPVSARVSDDGLRIETEPTSMRVSNFYFAAVARKSTTIVGRVLKNDGVTPVTRALARFRGQEAFTDGNGSFVLRYVPVRPNESISVEISYLWPSGRVDKIDSSEFTAVVGGISRMPDVILPYRVTNRPPSLNVPGNRSVMIGNSLNFDITASDPDEGQTLTFSTASNLPIGASLTKLSPTTARFSWFPNQSQSGAYQVTFKVTDNGTPPLSDQRSITINVFLGVKSDEGIK